MFRVVMLLTVEADGVVIDVGKPVAGVVIVESDMVITQSM
jgi:hypothetical protein